MGDKKIDLTESRMRDDHRPAKGLRYPIFDAVIMFLEFLHNLDPLRSSAVHNGISSLHHIADQRAFSPVCRKAIIIAVGGVEIPRQNGGQKRVAQIQFRAEGLSAAIA